MKPEERNSEARKLLKDPYEVLGIGYTQFEKSQSFILKYFCFVALLFFSSLIANNFAGPNITGQGYVVPFVDRWTPATDYSNSS